MDQLIENLKAVVGADAVLDKPEELLVYECDGLPQHKYLPRAVVFPQSTEETSEVMRVLARSKVPFTPRGAGTGLSGGALALNSGVVIELARMRRILEIDQERRIARVQTGVVNLHVSQAVAQLGLHYIPDPSSQPTCTIGGNIAENAGGIHCLKYGTTTDHVLSARVVLAGGEVLELTSAEAGGNGYDLLGVFIGSEGTFGVATEATLRLTPLPPSIRTLLAEFAEVDDASHAVSAIIAAGLMPAALEMMDREIIRAIEASVFAAGLPPDAGAALLIELDGIEAGLDDQAELAKAICIKYGARSCRLAGDENERKKLWAARKGAFGAVGRIAPDSMIQDAVVPRSQLPEVMRQSYGIAAKYGLILANVFHAGDGNLHPFICFDSRSPDEVRRVKEAGRELMETCVRAGGTITGEHGVGLDKRDYLPLIFSEADMDAMLRVRAAFDPSGLCNPGKIIPMLRGCGEARAVSLSTQPLETQGAAVATQAFRASTIRSPGAVPSNEALRVLAAAPARTTVPNGARGEFKEGIAARFLSQIVGEAYVTAADDRCPWLTVAPASAAEISEVMKLADREHWRVEPSGASTNLKSQAAGRRANLIVSTLRLNRILDHEPADLIARTEAGVTLAALNARLSSKGQWLPLDPPGGASATVGGVVATGLGGAQTFGYGPPRRHVIGMQVVLADGSVIKAGGRVVKNVAGYDLCKLFTGSNGTLGIVVELSFKLRPRPEREVTAILSGNAESLVFAARQILETRLFPVALELISPALAQVFKLPTNGNQPVLLARFAGGRATVDFQTNQTRSIVEAMSTPPTLQLNLDDARLWNELAGGLSEHQKTGIPACPDHLKGKPGVVEQVLQPVEFARFLEDLSQVGSSLWQLGLADGRMRIFAEDDRQVEFSKYSKTQPGVGAPLANLISRIREQLDPRAVFLS